MKILLGYQPYYESKRGLRVALKFAKSLNAEVLVIASDMTGEKGHTFYKGEKELRERLAEAKKFFEENGVTCRTEYLDRGREPWDDIVDKAEEYNADFIVLGNKKRSRFEKILVGSTTQRVILEADCPVMTYKEE